MRLRAIVVGSGWGEKAARALAAHGSVELTALVARGSPRSQALAASLQVPLFPTVADALHEGRADLAAVAVDERVNPLLAEELLEAGAHVLCSHPVASEASTVLRLAGLARRRQRLISADYSFRATPGYARLLEALRGVGALLRLSVLFPGRGLPMALDLAIGLGGPVARLSAFGQYPAAVGQRRQRTPGAFPPALVLEHRGGCVSTLVSVPHARPHDAYSLTASAEGARLEAAFPAGEVRRIECRRGHEVDGQLLHAPGPPPSAEECFGGAMAGLVGAFVEAALTGGAPPSPLEEEARIRAAGSAIPIALRTGFPARVEEVP